MPGSNKGPCKNSRYREHSGAHPDVLSLTPYPKGMNKVLPERWGPQMWGAAASKAAPLREGHMGQLTKVHKPLSCLFSPRAAFLPLRNLAEVPKCNTDDRASSRWIRYTSSIPEFNFQEVAGTLHESPSSESQKIVNSNWAMETDHKLVSKTRRIHIKRQHGDTLTSI